MRPLNYSAYKPSTKIGHIDFGNGVETTYAYDDWSQRLTGIQTTAAANAIAQDREYTYSPAGDITVIDDLARVETYFYSYDKLHRLTSETTSTGSAGVTPALLQLKYDDPNHIHAVSEVISKGISHAYAYDENGNQESGPDMTDPMSVVARSMTWNADNMTTSVVHPAGGTIYLTYDGVGKRAKKTGAGKEIYYFSDEFEIIDGVETSYIFAGNLRVAMIRNITQAYFHKDHLGSSTAVTDAQGNIIETAMYMPFGGKRGAGGISVSRYQYTDQEFEAESGLYNYDARHYDPIVGSFISADPIVQSPYSPQSINRYSYCWNNPLIYVDPTGYSVGPDAGPEAAMANAAAEADADVADSLANDINTDNNEQEPSFEVADLSDFFKQAEKTEKSRENVIKSRDEDEKVYLDILKGRKSEKEINEALRRTTLQRTKAERQHCKESLKVVGETVKAVTDTAMDYGKGALKDGAKAGFKAVVKSLAEDAREITAEKIKNKSKEK